MKVSLNELQKYSNVDLTPNGVDALIEAIGLQLGAVEDVQKLSDTYEGVVVAKVVSSEPHPNADKLKFCVVDDNGVTENVNRTKDGHVEVVCGAPNVAAGQLIAWIPPGAIVPVTYGTAEPFVLEAKELRGIISNGMIASAKELDLGDDHAGILVLETDTQPGTAFAEAAGLDDTIIDLENKMFTHRPDCFGDLGVARELAGIQGQKFTSPEWYWKLPRFESGIRHQKLEDELIVQVEVPELAPRFMAVVMSGVEVNPSPLWMQTALTKVGIKPINNIVDSTNYVMHLTGQPLHAYDYDKLAALAAKSTVNRQPSTVDLTARLSKPGEKLTLLGGKEIVFEDDSTIVIASGGVPVGIGGAMGGADTEVSESTKNIVLECATFDMYSIRRTAMRFGLFTEAVTRFNKGQSPLQNDRALAYASQQIGELAGAKQASDVQDARSMPDQMYDSQSAGTTLVVQPKFINARLGSDLSAEEICTLLRNVEFAASASDKQDGLEITPPFWRMDIKLAEDIVEEVGRLHGYSKLPVTLPARPTKPPTRNVLMDFKQRIRQTLASRGANELLTYSFVKEALLTQVDQNPNDAYRIRNALSPDLQLYRLSLVPSLLGHVHPNIKAGYDDITLYELGAVHSKQLPDPHEPDLPNERELLGLVTATHAKRQLGKTYGASFYRVRAYLDELATTLGLELTYQPVTAETLPLHAEPFQPERSATLRLAGEDAVVGIIGELTSPVRQSLKLPRDVAAAEIDVNLLLQAAVPVKYHRLSRFPSITADLTVAVDAKVAHAHVLQRIREVATASNPASTLQTRAIYQPDNVSKRHHTFRLTCLRHDRTMTQIEVNDLIDAVIRRLKADFGAERL